jgi:uncharacterized protein YndB with AHSA1/START domain
MIEPLRLSWKVNCSPTVAFDLWTEQTLLWWPPSHTISHQQGAAVRFEPRVGGRIVERNPDGEQRDWGEVLAWDPPHRLVYTWHIFSDPNDATEVEVLFTPNNDGTTTVVVEHRGWDAFADGLERRQRNHIGWDRLIQPYTTACNTYAMNR